MIQRMRRILDNCYVNDELNYESKLKVSQYMDKLITRYYELKNDFLEDADCNKSN